MTEKKAQILAPAGSLECVKAAVRCGADAVYLGTKDFNARRNAENFSYEQLKNIIEYCHAHGVRVHITANTLISDDEIPVAIEMIKHICKLGADVLILQDLGFAALVKEMTGEIERHASTQMSVQTVSGLKLLEELGYSLAVLPRELSKKEIENARENTSIQLETFVHGALCMCVSGQCYLSSMLGGRSGNRGLCAQPCRLAFSAAGKGGNDLSLKDLSLIDKLQELSKIGIDCFKIEGRMKRPEYVAASVTAAKAFRDGHGDEKISEALTAVFSRSGFTDGYYQNKLGKDMFGIRTRDDVKAADSKVLSSLERLYDKETPSVAVDFYLCVLEGEQVSLSARAQNKTCFVTEDYIPEKAINKPSTEEGLKERLSKCGGTMFFANSVEIELDEGLIVPASVINSLRRKALEELQKKLSVVNEKAFTKPDTKVFQHKAREKMKLHIRLAKMSQLPKNLDEVEKIYIPLSVTEKELERFQNFDGTVAVEIPRGIFGTEPIIKKQLERVKKLGINAAYCSTLDALAIAREMQMEIHTGFSMNVYNSFSVKVLEQLGAKTVTLSCEMTLQKLVKIACRVERGIIAYGRLPLMLTRNCPMKNVTDCSQCKQSGFLKDRKGIIFPIACTNGCSEILNSRPIYMADRLDEIKNMDFITLYFTRESDFEVQAVLDAYKSGKSPSGEFTRGLYYREVQ